jgi:hypothetical protein
VEGVLNIIERLLRFAQWFVHISEGYVQGPNSFVTRWIRVLDLCFASWKMKQEGSLMRDVIPGCHHYAIGKSIGEVPWEGYLLGTCLSCSLCGFLFVSGVICAADIGHVKY